MWRVSKSYCGCSLKTGTMIILWSDLLFRGLIVMFLAITAFSNRGPGSTNLPALNFFIIFFIIVLIITISALVGAIQRQSALMKPYIILSIIFLVLIAINTLSILAALVSGDQAFDMIIGGPPKPSNDRAAAIHLFQAVFAVCFIFMVLFLLLNGYSFCIVYSYYKEVQEEQTTGTYNRGTGVAYSAPKRGLSAEQPQPAATLNPQ